MDVVAYVVDAYNFLLTLVGLILNAFVGPLGLIAGIILLLLIAAGVYVVSARRRPRR